MGEEAVYRFMRPLVSPRCAVAVAVSGGSDSMALLGLLVAVRERLGLARLAVAHVDHGLRGEESRRERWFVEEAARRAGCPFHVRELSGRRAGDTGIEAWARAERYRFFAELRRREGYRWIATGHTVEDQAETVLLRLMRGTGMVGLGGIRPVRDDGIVRPVLALHRGELRAWLERRGWGWCTDSSNLDTRLRRNWVRRVLLPVIVRGAPDAVERLAASADAARELEGALAPWVNKWLRNFVLNLDTDGAFLKKPFAPFPAREAVAWVCRRLGIACDRAHLDAFLRDAVRTHGEFLLPGGWRYYPLRDRVEICRGGREPSGDFVCRLRVPGRTECRSGERFSVVSIDRRAFHPAFDRSNRTVWLDRDETGDELTYRRVGAEDRFVPLGGRSYVRVISYLKKRGIAARARGRAGVVTGAKGEVVWIPGVAVGERFRIREGTERIVRISYGSNT